MPFSHRDRRRGRGRGRGRSSKTRETRDPSYVHDHVHVHDGWPEPDRPLQFVASRTTVGARFATVNENAAPVRYEPSTVAPPAIRRSPPSPRATRRAIARPTPTPPCARVGEPSTR